MPLSFERPIGIRRDIPELEYVIALMQTCNTNISLKNYIRTKDIVYYLKSRHGINVTIDIVYKLIFQELIGQINIINEKETEEQCNNNMINIDDSHNSSSNDENNNNNNNNNVGTSSSTAMKSKMKNIILKKKDNVQQVIVGEYECTSYCIDICQLVSVLLIPTLLEKANKNLDEGGSSQYFDAFYNSIFTADGNISVQKLKKYFYSLGETQVPNDLLVEMISLVQNVQHQLLLYEKNNNNINNNNNNLSTSNIIAKVLTDDIQLLNLNWENLDTTNFDDVTTVIQNNNNNNNLQADTSINTTTTKVVEKQQQEEEEMYSDDPIMKQQTLLDDNNNNNNDNDRNGKTMSNTTTTTTTTALATTTTTNNNNNSNILSNTLTNTLTTSNKVLSNTYDVIASNQIIKKAFDEEQVMLSEDTTRIQTLAGIDYTADTFRRPLFVMMLWSSGIAAYFAYVLGQDPGDLLTIENCNGSESACAIAEGLVAWIAVFVQLVVMGVPYVVLSSFGNSVYVTNKLHSIAALCIGIAAIFMITIFPYFTYYKTDFYDLSINQDTPVEEYCNNDLDCIEYCNKYPDECHLQYKAAENFLGATPYIALILGCMLVMSQIVDILYVLVPKQWLHEQKILRKLFTPAGLRKEGMMKKAASYRMSEMLDNAFSVCNNNNSDDDNINNDNENNKKVSLPSLEMFYNQKEETETVGGIIWAWKRIYDGTMFVQEGVWLHGRLLACNFSQLLVVAMIIFFTRFLYEWSDDLFYTSQEKDEKNYIDELKIKVYGNITEEFDDLFQQTLNCTEELIEANVTNPIPEAYSYEEPVGLAWYLRDTYGTFQGIMDGPFGDCLKENDEVATFFNETYQVLSYESQGLKDLITDLNIPHTRYIAAAWLGLLAGLAAASYIAIIMIPSYITSVMKYRCGIFPSLHERDFLRYRKSMDTITVLLGSAFWGSFFTATMAMFLAVLVLLGIVLVPLFVGGALGFAFTMLVRTVILMMMRCAFFKAFYRKNPASANISLIALEVWNIGLTFAFVLVRAVKLIAISIMFIARIDTPILAPGVGQVGPVELDGTSFSFRKDLLMHEAHRHMLIERFGLLCLLKIRAGSLFATRAGSAWRLLYVMSVMPWLNKYRVRPFQQDNSTVTSKLLLKDCFEEEEDETAQNESDDIESSVKQDRDEMARVMERNQFLEERVLALERELKSIRYEI